MMKILFIFIDGLGIAALNKDKNPLYYTTTGIFSTRASRLPQGGILFPLDATLGIEGLPQSATGQTALYTGLNAPEIIGKHLTGFPNTTLRKILSERSLFVVLKKFGLHCAFLNAFRPVFFSSPQIFTNAGLSASSEMNRAAGLPFRTLRDIREGKALYHDYTNNELIAKGFEVPEFDYHKAAKIMTHTIRSYDFMLYEYFLTDKAGHSKNMDAAISEIKKVENLLLEILRHIDFKDTVVIAVSDHGNIEDISVKTHTYHPAFMAVWGFEAKKVILSLKDVYSFVLEILDVPLLSNT
jgi:2,3-bisphosphoglycerate-independent phosphoglycerate mutase